MRKIVFILITLFFTFLFNNTFATNNWVVQIISYWDIYWKHPQMIWWWSASIINKNGIIISNNHVVDDGRGWLLSAFWICVTKDFSKTPVCDYTATLIDRDDKLDISILKIDEYDIYWKKVDYNSFDILDMYYDYNPKNKDEVIAIWYPWIWADTISETKWIVSWISEYNGFQYIKTDALIAWWNSWGALVLNWKIIWIPTFWIGFWDSMWYALLISEAKEFILKNIDKTPKKQEITNMIDFVNYKKIIQNINSVLILKDDIFDLQILPGYQLSNYIKNKSLELSLKTQKDSWVQKLNIYINKAPKIKNDNELFYFFETQWFYFRESQKLEKKQISWVDFYYTVEKTDLSGGYSSWGNSYFAIINGYLITINVERPFYDEKVNKETKKELDDIFKKININFWNLNKTNFSFQTNIPKVDIQNFTNSISDTWFYKLYFWNLYEYFEIYINELVEYNWKWKNVDEIYQVLTKDIDISLKSKFKFNSLDWYMTCFSSNYWEYYNYYSTYNENYITKDENWNDLEIVNCDINIFFPYNKLLNKHNYLSIKIQSTKNNISTNLDKTIFFLKKYLNTYTPKEDTNIKNILKQEKNNIFQDLNNQTKEYKKFLSLLLRYSMIRKTSNFDWNRPIKYWDFFYTYLSNIYKIDLSNKSCKWDDYECIFNKKISWKTINQILKNDLWIESYDNFVDKDKISNLDFVLNVYISWVNKKDFDSIDELFHNLNLEKYKKIKEKINSFNNSIFWNKKILLQDFYFDFNTIFYTDKYAVYYPDLNKLIYKQKDSIWDFWYKKPSKEDLFLEEYDYYNVLTKADMIEFIFSKVDFWLFDKELLKRKD